MTACISFANAGSPRRLASGGQGMVFAAPGSRMQYAPSLVFKQYNPGHDTFSWAGPLLVRPSGPMR